MQDLNDKVTGNSLTAGEWNEVPSEMQNIIENAGLTLSSGDLNQLGKAIAQYVSDGDFYEDSGAADAYVLSGRSTNQEIVAYTDGVRIRFRPDNTNTGASTVNVNALGAKNIFYNGAALTAGRIVASETVIMEYNTADNRFNIISIPAETNGYTAVGYSIINGSYDSKSYDPTSEDIGPSDACFKTDGTKMYVLGVASDTVYQYSLSTAWDISTASYDSKSFSVTSQDSSPSSVAFKADGTKMYMAGQSNDTVYQYSLSTAWDISTASYDTVSFSIAAQELNILCVFFKPDGTKMYIVGNVTDTIYQYSLSTAWDMTTASYDTVSLSVGSLDNEPTALAFKSDGTQLYFIGKQSKSIHEYSLTTAWDISTATYYYNTFNTTAQGSDPLSLVFKDDGTKMYIMDTGNDNVYQYSCNFLSQK